MQEGINRESLFRRWKLGRCPAVFRSSLALIMVAAAATLRTACPTCLTTVSGLVKQWVGHVRRATRTSISWTKRRGTI